MLLVPPSKAYLISYGLFMVTWSVFETILDVTIAREAGLKPPQSIIVTSGLGFERKASIARSLLALHKPQNEKAISLINKITQEASRNSLVHGIVFVGQNAIEFIKCDTDQSLKVKSKKFKDDELASLVASICGMIDQLQIELSVSNEDLAKYGDSLKSLVTKAPTSPKPPSSTSTS